MLWNQRDPLFASPTARHFAGLSHLLAGTVLGPPKSIRPTIGRIGQDSADRAIARSLPGDRPSPVARGHVQIFFYKPHQRLSDASEFLELAEDQLNPLLDSSIRIFL